MDVDSIENDVTYTTEHKVPNQESYLPIYFLKPYFDIKRIEIAYHELNQREYELTKHVSLLQADPLALLQLRTTGSCTVTLPEALFDMDGPGHYFRRIKTVALSIPCVAGPYASVNCTLTLQKSSIRKTSLLSGDVYARDGAEDERFSDHFGSLQSIVTSTAQNDSGMFETNLRDERYLPFENSGAISEWKLQLPADPSKGEPAQFDYSTISDVIMHIRYTAREGGDRLRGRALTQINDLINEGRAAGSVRLFSIRHEFPAEWAKFRGVQTGDANPPAKLTVEIRPEHFPFWSKGRLQAIREIKFFAPKSKDKPQIIPSEPTTGAVDVISLDSVGVKKVKSQNSLTMISIPQPPDNAFVALEFHLEFKDNTMENLWLALNWGNAE